MGRAGCRGMWMTSWEEMGVLWYHRNVGTSWARSLEEDDRVRDPISGFNNSPGDKQSHERDAGRRVCQGTVAPPAWNDGLL